jgi:hypothetical protein
VKTPHSILNFTQQSWMPAVKQLQRLQADVSAACIALGVPQAADCELTLEVQTLTIKTSAVLATRLRQIEPELKALLNAQSWNLSALDIRVVRNAHALARHLHPDVWISPNEQRYGKRQAPTPEQRAIILPLLKIKRRTAIKLG